MGRRLSERRDEPAQPRIHHEPGAAQPGSPDVAAVLALQRSAGNHAVQRYLAGASRMLQRQKTVGPYVLSTQANFRRDDDDHTVIRELNAGTRVDVIDKGSRKSSFKAGWVSNEHSWSMHGGQAGWIEDSKLAPAPQRAPATGERDDDSHAQSQQDPRQSPQAHGRPVAPRPPRHEPLPRLFPGIDNERSEVRYQATTLQEVASRVVRPAPGSLTPDQRDAATAWIQRFVNKDQGGGGGDHIKRCVEQVPTVVKEAAHAGYNIRVTAVRQALGRLAVALASCEGTQMGQHRGGDAMGAFFQGTLPAHLRPQQTVVSGGSRGAH